MPYVDVGQRSNDIAHCRKCGFQWVIAPNTKGVSGSTNNPRTGRVCPFCKSQAVYYTKEDNR